VLSLGAAVRCASRLAHSTRSTAFTPRKFGGYQVTNPTNGTKYSFRILAHNAAGWGPASTVTSAVPGHWFRVIGGGACVLVGLSGDDCREVLTMSGSSTAVEP
jgi:hypothetical protein